MDELLYTSATTTATPHLNSATAATPISPSVPANPHSASVPYHPPISYLLHARMGHRGRLHLQRTINRYHIPCPLPSTAPDCVVCSQCKIHRSSVSGRQNYQTTRPMEGILMDMGGPFDVDGLGGERFILLIIDSHTKARVIGYSKTKEPQEIFHLVRHLLWRLSSRGRFSVSWIRSDNQGNLSRLNSSIY